jgi:MOSC domain-containing protein YiiM
MGNYRVNYKNKTFKEEKIELDGKYFFNCTFKKCMFILEKGNTGFKGCEVSGCQLMLRGKAYTIAKIITKLNRKGTFKIIDFEEPLVEDKIHGNVMAVCIGVKKGKPKIVKDVIFLKSGHGVEGDSHAGTKREVSLLAEEHVTKFTEKTGIIAPPGCFAENIRVRWLSPADLKVGTHLAVGEAELKVTSKGKPDSEKHDYSYEGYSLMTTEGIFARVIQSGKVKTGDPVRLTGWEK